MPEGRERAQEDTAPRLHLWIAMIDGLYLYLRSNPYGHALERFRFSSNRGKTLLSTFYFKSPETDHPINLK